MSCRPGCVITAVIIVTDEETAHREEAAGEDQQLSGSAEGSRDRSFPAGREYQHPPTCPPPPLETCFTSGPVSQQQSKLEKADILEMTVRHLQNIQSSKRGGKTSDLVFRFGSFALFLSTVVKSDDAADNT